ncbi:MAG TPA: hypothetical protein PK300_08355 [Bacillota bacterium]|nr:hypothetical protein [Bacillota bacterium]
MARPAKTKTHLENLVIIPKTAHGDAEGDTVFAIYPIDSYDINGTPTAKFSVDEDGDTLIAGTLGVNGAVTLRAGRVPLIKRTVTDYNAQTATLTVAGLLGGIVTQNSKTGPSTATTPTGAEISAGIAGVSVGDSFSCLYYNRGNQTSTIKAGASGVTVYGNTSVPALKTAELIFHCTAANTWSCYVVLSA